MSSSGTYKTYSYIVILCVCLWVIYHVNELLCDRQFSLYMKYFLLEGLTYMFFSLSLPCRNLTCLLFSAKASGG